jgi:hypothetical protein
VIEAAALVTPSAQINVVTLYASGADHRDTLERLRERLETVRRVQRRVADDTEIQLAAIEEQVAAFWKDRALADQDFETECSTRIHNQRLSNGSVSAAPDTSEPTDSPSKPQAISTRAVHAAPRMGPTGRPT